MGMIPVMKPRRIDPACGQQQNVTTTTALVVKRRSMKARIERKALRVLPMRCPFSCNSISISPRLARAFDIRSGLARLSILKCNFKSNPDPQNQRMAVSIPM